MTDLDIAELRRLEKAATPGPWRAVKSVAYLVRDKTADYPEDQTGNVQLATFGDMTDKEVARFNKKRWIADAELSAAARNALPLLLDSHDAQVAEIATLRRQLAEREAEVERLKVSAKSSAEENEYLHNKLCEAHLDPSK